jgi:uncharacterized membrane protein
MPPGFSHNVSGLHLCDGVRLDLITPNEEKAMIDIVHIHPMLVHFPIVLYLLAVGLQLLVLVRRGDLAADACLANSAFGALLLAAVAAGVTAFFGDIAFDHAVSLGFPKPPLDAHANLGISTMSFMIALAVIHLAARWRHWSFGGPRGWLSWGVALAGVVLLIVTAYHGGNLVYRLGVNVRGVVP